MGKIKAVLQSILPNRIVCQHDADLSKILRYAEYMKNGNKFPPAILAVDGDTILPIDGHHRAYASKMAGAPIDAWCISFDQFDEMCMNGIIDMVSHIQVA